MKLVPKSHSSNRLRPNASQFSPELRSTLAWDRLGCGVGLELQRDGLGVEGFRERFFVAFEDMGVIPNNFLDTNNALVGQQRIDRNRLNVERPRIWGSIRMVLQPFTEPLLAARQLAQGRPMRASRSSASCCGSIRAKFPLRESDCRHLSQTPDLEQFRVHP
jgi:hypothetical protein